MDLRLPTAVTTVRRAVLRRRRLIAVALLGVAVAASLRTLAPPPADTATMVVASRDLAAGATLAPDDVEEVEVPPGVVPQGAVGEPVGRLLAAPLRRGEPVTDVRLVGAALTAGAAGEVAVPVRLSDPGQAALLTVGDRIDLLATDPQAGTTRLLASGVTVLAVPRAAVAGDGALPGRLVVVGLRSEEHDRITTAAVTAFVTFRWGRS